MLTGGILFVAVHATRYPARSADRIGDLWTDLTHEAIPASNSETRVQLPACGLAEG
jgi:hypothetical protein